jgi:hypothetical protein
MLFARESGALGSEKIEHPMARKSALIFGQNFFGFQTSLV